MVNVPLILSSDWSGHGLAPCSLDPGQRNIVPELADPWLCQWAECEMAHAQTSFTQPQHFYSHVTSHAEVRLRSSLITRRSI